MAPTAMLDQGARLARQDPADRREKWDKECTVQKEERESQVRSDPMALLALSPRRDREKSFS